MLIQFTPRWAQALPWANSLKWWVVEVRSYPSPKGLGEFSCQQHVGNEKRKKKRKTILGKRKWSSSNLNILFFPEGAILCLRLTFRTTLWLVSSRASASDKFLGQAGHLSFHQIYFPQVERYSFLEHPPLIWNVCCSHQKASAQFWLERNGGQDSCEGQKSAKLGKVDTGDLNFLKFWSGMLRKMGEVRAAFPKDTMEEGGLLFYAWCTWNNPQ